MAKDSPLNLLPSSLGVVLVGLLVGLGPSALALEPSEVARAVDASVVRIYIEGPPGKGSGTGFVVSDDHVVTNFHVVEAHLKRGWQLYVLERGAEPEKRLPVTVVEAFPGEDLAILEVAGLGRPPVRFAHAEAPDGSDPGTAKGVRVFGIGFPGAADRLGPMDEASFAPGLVSRMFRGSWSADGPQITIIQHTAPTNPGNSGGPLVNACAEVIGINTQREVRMIRGPGGIPLVSDPIQGVFFSQDAAGLLAKLDQLGIPYVRAEQRCVARGGFGTIPAYLLITILLALGGATFAVVFYKPRPVVHVIVRCGEMVEQCIAAIRQAMAKSG